MRLMDRDSFIVQEWHCKETRKNCYDEIRLRRQTPLTVVNWRTVSDGQLLIIWNISVSFLCLSRTFSSSWTFILRGPSTQILELSSFDKSPLCSISSRSSFWTVATQLYSWDRMTHRRLFLENNHLIDWLLFPVRRSHEKSKLAGRRRRDFGTGDFFKGVE